MEYQVRSLSEDDGGFKHVIRLKIKPDRREELRQFLSDTFGREFIDWCFWFDDPTRFHMWFHPYPASVLFTSKENAIIFKLGWQECEDTKWEVKTRIIKIRTIPDLEPRFSGDNTTWNDD